MSARFMGASLGKRDEDHPGRQVAVDCGGLFTAIAAIIPSLYPYPFAM